MIDRTCIVADCSKPARSPKADYCKMHYHRLWRHGTLELLQPQRERRGVCIVEGCELVDVGSHGLCSKHRTRQERHGSPEVVLGPEVRYGDENPSWTGDAATYNAVHIRLRKAWGPARRYQCVECDAQARHWSYDHQDTDEKSSSTYGPYSVDLTHYQPRCVSCHKKYDLDRQESTKRSQSMPGSTRRGG